MSGRAGCRRVQLFVGRAGRGRSGIQTGRAGVQACGVLRSSCALLEDGGPDDFEQTDGPIRPPLWADGGRGAAGLERGQ